MDFTTYKINFKLVRSFSVGFAVFSPKLNGFYVEAYLGCFHIAIWNRGKLLIGFNNYWRG